MKKILLSLMLGALVLSSLIFNNVGCGSSPTQAAGYTPVPTAIPTVTTPTAPGTPTFTSTSTPTVTTTATPTVTATVTTTATPPGKNISLMVTGTTSSGVESTDYRYVSGVLTKDTGNIAISAGSTFIYPTQVYQSGEIARVDVYGPTIPTGAYSYTAMVVDEDTNTVLKSAIGTVSSSATTLTVSYTIP